MTKSATTTNPNSVEFEQARAEAHAKLNSEGWVYVEEAVEFRHADGRRGRLVFEPDFNAPLDDGMTAWVRGVKLQAPGRKPTLEDMQNRVSTAGAKTDVVTYW
jgi:hypothetical protein